ncbi:TetR/AcrR family transcriptional regulator C-terminal domain-containing protein [Dactylosporangium aurantiacum]|uniref:TetR/AcrR family transcriptional regulator C-terminal domain-containing protein n=1 Tax=Dactylosporangium aurantiacum TaxID=35754 RepID=A0A9Q9MJ72_9ACTN|nr:TetR/AcrR family transcriptional regulator C-terminal domain-containing protein [Dactylosporangium aurantiacum]MDG6107721.1 TetR/AcrR family transcriptional regulator C-terminal domain-containing protein [Dactylosporangium aurantiacum]UWZ58689.1 TetR/AcrR family transcriptional regulator C-terminal domain-containing protein [Dactylosporangium aurantiacum]
MSLVWERPVPDRRRSVSLDRERIVAAATALADAEGLEAVTLRRVAAGLDVLPMRLYTYLETKDDLLDLMADWAYQQIELPGPRTGWRPALRAVAQGLRTVAAEHPWLVTLLANRPPYGPNGLRLVERVWSALYDRAADPATAAAACTAFIGYVTGALAQEAGQPHHPGVERYLATAVTDGPFPTLARAFAELAPADTVAAGLEVVLDGIAARL